MYAKQTIKQIMPATGLFAVYVEESKKLLSIPVTGHMLYTTEREPEGDVRPFIIGYDGCVEFPDRAENFIGYVTTLDHITEDAIAETHDIAFGKKAKEQQS
jgi:hypothetical protein